MSAACERPAGPDDPRQVWQRTATGGLLMLVGCAAGLPLGLVVSALLARGLGPEDFGHLSVAVSMVLLAHSTVSTLFNRTAIKMVADTPAWEPVAVALSRLHLLLGLAMGTVVFLSAEKLASLMGAPDLAPLLRLLAASLPMVALAHSCQNVMIGRQLFERSALFPVVYDVTRVLLVVAFLGLGWGVTGAALAFVGGSLAQAVYAARALGVPMWTRAPLLPRGFFRYSLPLALDAAGKRLYGRIDLWAVQALSGSAAAGYYSAAQSFNAVGMVASSSLAPLLLATVSRAWTAGQTDAARATMREMLRLALWLLPFAALGAGAASELVAFVYGVDYLPAAPLLAWISFSIAGLVIMSLVTAMLAAIGRPGAAFAFNTPLLGIAVVGCLLLVPRIGAIGAASTITVAAWAVDLAIILCLRRWCGVGIKRTTALRVLGVTAVAYVLASTWLVTGPWVIAKLLVLCAAVLLLILALGELTRREISVALSLLTRGSGTSFTPAPRRHRADLLPPHPAVGDESAAAGGATGGAGAPSDRPSRRLSPWGEDTFRAEFVAEADEETATDAQVIVIGGGPAGLTAAYELTRLKVPCIVLEKENKVGGISRTESHDGCHFDMGGHRFFTKVKEVDQLWQRILGGDFLRRPRISRIYYLGRFFCYPLKPLNALLGLGFANAVLIVLSYVRWQLFPYRQEDTFEQWVTNRFGRRLFRIFFKTYTEKVWGIPCSELRAEWAAQRIKDLSLGTALLSMFLRPRKTIRTLIDQFDYPRLGPGMMWGAFKDRVEAQGGEVRLSTEVVAIRRVRNRVRGVVASRDGRSEVIQAAHTISSMPITELVKKLDPPPPPHVLEAANRLSYRDFLTVCLIANSPNLFPDNWIYVHDPTVKVGRIQNFKNWSIHMVRDPSKTSLGLEYFCTEGDEIWRMADADLIELGKREVDRIGIARYEDLENGCVFRVLKAYPVYDSHYQSALSTIRRFVDRLQGFQTIGRNGLHRYNNMDHAMLTGMLAARNVALGERNDVWNVNMENGHHEDLEAPKPADAVGGSKRERAASRPNFAVDHLVARMHNWIGVIRDV